MITKYELISEQVNSFSYTVVWIRAAYRLIEDSLSVFLKEMHYSSEGTMREPNFAVVHGLEQMMSQVHQYPSQERHHPDHFGF